MFFSYKKCYSYDFSDVKVVLIIWGVKNSKTNKKCSMEAPHIPISEEL
jgi:hypothetical protein